MCVCVCMCVCGHIVTLKLLQNCMDFIVMWNIKEDILKNVVTKQLEHFEIEYNSILYLPGY